MTMSGAPECIPCTSSEIFTANESECNKCPNRVLYGVNSMGVCALPCDDGYTMAGVICEPECDDGYFMTNSGTCYACNTSEEVYAYEVECTKCSERKIDSSTYKCVLR